MKKIKSHELTTLQFSGTLDEIIKELKEKFNYYSEKGYSNVRVDYDYSSEDGCSYYSHNLIGDRLETDEEEALREKEEEAFRVRSEEYQRQQYEALKAKFETGN